MLPKNRRIQRKMFSNILATGRRFNSPHLLLYVSKIDEKEKQTFSRFSFSISKKIMKHAVDRNLYRRRGYACVSKIIDTISPNHFFFFVYKKGTYPLSFSDLEKEVFGLLKPVN